MPREIRYSPKVVGKTRKVRRGKATKPQDDPTQLPDGYRDKLIKYVPVEATVFFALAYGKLGEKIDGSTASGRAWWSLIIAVGAFIAILFAGAGRRARDPFPWYFYVLTSLAFIAWAVGTTGIMQEMFAGFVTEANDVVFAGAAFIIPGVDQLLSREKEQAPGA